MRVLVRTIMAASLIMADAAQAASLTATQDGGVLESQAARYQARLKNILDRDEKSWKRLSASICAGCGSPPPPLAIAHATPLYVRTQREAIAALPSTEAATSNPAIKPVSIRNAAVLHRKEPSHVERAKPNTARLAKARRHVRFARLRLIRHQRRLALLQAEKRRQAAAALTVRHQGSRIRLAGLGFGGPGGGADRAGSERRPTPFPPPRPDMLCADDRGLSTAGIRSSSACISPR